MFLLAAKFKLKVKYPGDEGEDVAELKVDDRGPRQCILVRLTRPSIRNFSKKTPKPRMSVQHLTSTERAKH